MTEGKEDWESSSVATSTTSSTSPFRPQRFSSKTRREALKQLLNKNTPTRSTKNNDRTPQRSREKICISETTTSTTTETDGMEECEIDDPPEYRRKLPQHIDNIIPSLLNEVSYYRVTYPGIIALVSKPNSKSAKSGAYLSYGDIFESRYQLDTEEIESYTLASDDSLTQQKQRHNPLEVWDDESYSPPRTVLSIAEGSEVSSLNTLPTVSSIGGPKYNQFDHTQQSRKRQDIVQKQAIRVDRVLTGGYAMDGTEADKTPFSTDHDLERTPKSKSNAFSLLSSPLPLDNFINEECISSSQEQKAYGFIMSMQKNITLLDCILVPPKIQKGSFLYQITSRAPVPIFTSPCWDAPITRAVLLPGTIHKVCLKLHEEKEDVNFLRLSHRRGWICENRVFKSNDGTITTGSLLAMQEVESDKSVMRSTSRRYRPPRRKRDVQRPIQVITPNHSGLGSPNVSILSDEDEYRLSPVKPKPNGNKMDSSAAGSNINQNDVVTPSLFLYKVNAPKGLKILDAPHFQVNTLIRGGAGISGMRVKIGSATGIPSKLNPKVRNAPGESMFSSTGKSHTLKLSTGSGNPAIYDSLKKQRILPRGAIFEACRRIERSASLIQGGAGLIKLSDNSGWAIIPGQEELDIQYRHFHMDMSKARKGEAMLAVEEVGNAIIHYTNNSTEERTSDCIWVQAISRHGVQVECAPPPTLNPLNDQSSGSDMSPQSTASSLNSGGGSSFGILTNQDSDVASSVGSAFLDVMFRTPKRGSTSSNNEFSFQGRQSNRKPPQPFPSTGTPSANENSKIPSGMFFEINKWDDSDSSPSVQQFVRIRGGQGWVPRLVVGKPVIERIESPYHCFGSFWFRVVARRGIKVRLGPSRRATSIKSEDGMHFRFETGEFLRASEIVTFNSGKSSAGMFVKLYRNRHVQLNESQFEHRPLQAIAGSAEWVQTTSEDSVFLEECKFEPKIQRHRGGWRYNAVCENDIIIRKGPSFDAEPTGKDLAPGQSVLVTERVLPPAEQITWLRLKDGRGWVHDYDNNEAVMIPHNFQDQRNILHAPLKTERSEKDEAAYNTLVARLFPSSDDDKNIFTRL